MTERTDKLAPVSEERLREIVTDADNFYRDEIKSMARECLAHRTPASTGEVDNWRDDPASDERWNAGVNYAIEQLCSIFGVDPKSISWDAATETLDGDVSSVLCNVLRAAYGDEWASNERVTAILRVALTAAPAALSPVLVERHAARGLSEAEKMAQAKRCACRGSDEYCPCQNAPDAATRKEWGLAPTNSLRQSVMDALHDFDLVADGVPEDEYGPATPATEKEIAEALRVFVIAVRHALPASV